MRKFLQFLGFYGDDYEEGPDGYLDYEEEPSKTSPKVKTGRREEARQKLSPPKLVFFEGVPSEEIKLKLRDVLLDGAMVLLDLQKLEPEHMEKARNFINFMGGVAFAHKGVMEQIGPSLYIITPREEMCQWWVEEE